jgi:uncharacterized circularly permuted ATP-grasp superfamily protein
VPQPYEEAVAEVALEADLEALVAGVRERSAGLGVELDPMPRVIAAEDWQSLKVGLAQRAKALNAFAGDAYGERRIVKAGVVPARVIRTAAGYDPEMRGERLALWAGVVALDIARAPGGEFLVLADDVSTPDGYALAAAAREALLPMLDPPRGAAPRSITELTTSDTANAPGCGVADDRLTHAYVEDMVRFYLGEEPALRSVETLDLGRPDHLERALDTFGDLVVKPRAGGDGELVCPEAERATVETMRERVRAAPREWVAQPFVKLSRHLTVVGGRLVPRPVDLRAFVFMHGADHPRVLPGGLTRYDGGIKDTWVLPTSSA